MTGLTRRPGPSTWPKDHGKDEGFKKQMQMQVSRNKHGDVEGPVKQSL